MARPDVAVRSRRRYRAGLPPTTLLALADTPKSRFPLVLAILVGAFVLRLAGTLYGLPFGYHPDEEHILEPARRIASGGGLDPGWYRYPPLPIWLHALVYRIVAVFVEDAPNTFSSVSERIWIARLIGRAFSALAGVATVAVVWKASLRPFGQAAGGFAAAVLAFSFLHVQHSHFITTDVLAGLAAALVLAATLRAVESADETRTRWWLVAAALAGLAAGMKYNAGLVVLAPLIAWSVVEPRRAPRALVVCGVASFVAFVLAAPVLLVSPSAFLADVGFEVDHYAAGGSALVEGRFQGELGPVVLARFLVLRGVGVVGALGVATCAYTLAERRQWARFAAVFGFPLGYSVFLSTLSIQNDRLLLPLMPFVAVAAGLGLTELRDRLATRVRVRAAVVTGAIAVAAVVPLLVASTRYTVELVREDTRTRGYRFLDQYVPPTARICREWYTPEVPVTHRAFLLPTVCDRGAEALGESCEIVVTSSFIERLFATDDDEAYVADCYRDLHESWQLIGRFSGTPIDIYNDPTITILANPGLEIDMPGDD